MTMNRRGTGRPPECPAHERRARRRRFALIDGTAAPSTCWITRKADAC